jgi:glycosyltransferase involved in cell wall biosynthesis
MSNAFEYSLGTVIPVFIKKPADWDQLRRALTSLKNQSVLPEIVLLSDDSVDDNRYTFHQLSTEFGELNIHSIRNSGDRGISNNSNNGIRHVKTSYIHVLHQDDWLIDSDAYLNLGKLLSNNPQHFVFLGLQTFKENHKPVFDLTALVGNNQVGSPSGVIFPSNFGIFFDPNLNMLCDVDFYYRLNLVLGDPIILEGAVIKNGISDDQAQRSITREDFVTELKLILQKHQVSRIRIFIKSLSGRPLHQTYAILDSLRNSSEKTSHRIIFKLAMTTYVIFIRLSGEKKNKTSNI